MLTNESIRKKFGSQFELVNYAIKLSEQMIHSGRAPLVYIENENPAVIVIEEIEEGKDILDETLLARPLKNGVEKDGEVAPVLSVKPVEKKKTRRILA